jgi:hypothetical protein
MLRGRCALGVVHAGVLAAHRGRDAHWAGGADGPKPDGGQPDGGEFDRGRPDGRLDGGRPDGGRDGDGRDGGRLDGGRLDGDGWDGDGVGTGRLSEADKRYIVGAALAVLAAPAG